MANHTDLFPTPDREQSENADSAAGLVLAAVANHFTDVRPTEAMAPAALVVTVSSEAYNACGRSIGGRAAELSRAALAIAPEATGDLTRGEYALRLRHVLTSSGYEWSEDDNQRVIPIIPRQRQKPARPEPEQSDAPTCCGRPMNRDGQQWVCGKCGAWTDSGPGVANARTGNA